MKPNLILLTGWGSTSAVWRPIIPVIDHRYHIHCISPPWAPDCEPVVSLYDIDAYIGALAKTIQTASHVAAWSMGGLLAIRLAKLAPNLVTKIAFIASTAQFVNENMAINPDWFDSFQSNFNCQPELALKKFLALQIKGDEYALAALHFLRGVLPFAAYNFSECNYGLSLLEKLDLSRELKNLSCPSVFIHGECDAVLPVQAGRFAADLCDGQLYVIPAAGHAVHVSHPQQVAQYLLDFLD